MASASRPLSTMACAWWAEGQGKRWMVLVSKEHFLQFEHHVVMQGLMCSRSIRSTACLRPVGATKTLA